MKRILISVVLVVAMLASSVCIVGAESFGTLWDQYVTTPDRKVDIPVTIEANGASSVHGNVGTAITFKATLNMSEVKAAVAIISANLDDADKNKLVTGTITITAEWTGVNAPEAGSLTLKDLSGFTFKKDGSVVDGTDFFTEETERTLDGNKLTATINVKDGIDIEDLANLPDVIILDQGGFTLASNGEITGTLDVNIKIDENEDYTVPCRYDINKVTVIRKSSVGGSSAPTTTTTTTTNPDGSTTTTTTNKNTGTVTETTTNTDGSTSVVETKKDGTTTTTEKDTEGNITTTVETPEGDKTTTETKADGSEKVVEEKSDGTTTTTQKDTEGNISTKVETPEGNVTTEQTNTDGTTVKTETPKNSNTTAEITVPSKQETDVKIPVEKINSVTEIVITDKEGNTTSVEDYKVNEEDGSVTITVSDDVKVDVNIKFKEFDDVHSANHWAESEVDFVYAKDLMNGVSDSHFEPDHSITRGMFVTILYRLEGEPEIDHEVSFKDIEKGSYYEKAVAWGAKNIIIKGYSEDEYAPYEIITREQMAAIIYRYVEYLESHHIEHEVTDHDGYYDNHHISEYAKDAVEWNTEKGFLKGYGDGTFRPQNDATRAEAATIFKRIYKALEEHK